MASSCDMTAELLFQVLMTRYYVTSLSHVTEI